VHVPILCLVLFLFFRYPFEGLMVTIYGGNRPFLKCDLPFCPWRNPAQTLDKMDLKKDNYWLDVGGIVAWIFVLRIAFFIILKWKVYRKRGYW